MKITVEGPDGECTVSQDCVLLEDAIELVKRALIGYGYCIDPTHKLEIIEE